ncbi:MAG: hypothetical protein ACLVKA_02575 [Collinsella aerofaciens]
MPVSPGTVGILQQEPPLDEDKTVIENVRLAFADMIAKVERFSQISVEMCDPDATWTPSPEMGRLQDEIDTADGWDIDSKLGQAMDALQLPDSDMPVNVLSGGEPPRGPVQAAARSPRPAAARRPTNHLTPSPSCSSSTSSRTTPVPCRRHATATPRPCGRVDLQVAAVTLPHKGNFSTYLETKAARAAAQGQLRSAWPKRIAAELDWAFSPKARQAKNKARLARYEEMGRGSRQPEVDFTDIRIPVGLVWAPRSWWPSTCTRSSTAASSSTTSPTLPRNGIGRDRPQRRG